MEASEHSEVLKCYSELNPHLRLSKDKGELSGSPWSSVAFALSMNF